MARPRPGPPGKPRGKVYSKPRPSGAPAPARRAPRPKPAPTAPTGEPGPERLQKVLAAAGLGSRRSCEELILQGRVTVGGEVVRELGTKVDPGAAIEVDGTRIKPERPVYVVVAKPKGYVSTTSDPAGRPRVVDLVADVIAERVYTVGRLDEDSTGLMILTNDGNLANRLAHPRFGVEKVYRAVVAGRPEREVYDKLLEGVWLSEGKARARRVRVVRDQGDATVVEMVLSEGKNREVRRMWAKLGHKVMSLSRVAIGPISVKGLKAGQWRNLTSFEVNQLHQIAQGRAVPTAWFSATDRAVTTSTGPRRGPARHAAPIRPKPARADVPTGPAAGRRSALGSAERPTRRPPSGPAAGRRAAPESAERPVLKLPTNIPSGPAADRRSARGASGGQARKPPIGVPSGPAADRHPRSTGPASRHPPRQPYAPPARRPRQNDASEIEISPDLVAPAEGSARGKRPPTNVPTGPRAGRVILGMESKRPRPPARRARPLSKPRRKPPE